MGQKSKTIINRNQIILVLTSLYKVNENYIINIIIAIFFKQQICDISGKKRTLISVTD